MTDIVREALEAALEYAPQDKSLPASVRTRHHDFKDKIKHALAALSEREKSEDELVKILYRKHYKCEQEDDFVCYDNDFLIDIYKEAIRALSDAGVLAVRK